MPNRPGWDSFDSRIGSWGPSKFNRVERPFVGLPPLVGQRPILIAVSESCDTARLRVLFEDENLAVLRELANRRVLAPLPLLANGDGQPLLLASDVGQLPLLVSDDCQLSLPVTRARGGRLPG